MRLEDARGLALAEMEKWGLLEDGWKLEWSRAKTLAGSCLSSHKTIWLSRPLTELNDEAVVRDTVLHEIAHALVGTDEGHSRAWKRACERVGAVPEADSREGVFVPYRWLAECSCGASWGTHRRPSWGVACGDCGNRVTWDDSLIPVIAGKK